jgi:hypothetical protein
MFWLVFATIYISIQRKLTKWIFANIYMLLRTGNIISVLLFLSPV